MNAVIYIHGKGGSATESEHYKPLFSDSEVIGLDYQTFSDLKGTECGVAITPWETGKEIRIAVEELKRKYANVILIANSIGAFFSMIATPHFDHRSKNAGIDDMIPKAFFISPIVDMEKLINNMMKWANVTEQELESECVIHTDFGEDLSWEYLCYVRNHPITWSVPTQILYGNNDHLTSLETITDFANKHQATLTIMEGGEHWFHTEEQMLFLDKWIKVLSVKLK
jgi:pimeloyl-ACP methyl ester carboxylesterase